MQHKKTITEMEAEIRQLHAAMQLPGVTTDEIEIYKGTITRIAHQIAIQKVAQSNPDASPAPPAKTTDQIKVEAAAGYKQTNDSSNRVSPSPAERGSGGEVATTIRYAGPAPTTGPITASIQVENDTDPHNTKITITWSDGYAITVDETAARSNFTNRMRDACNLKCVKEARFEKIWKYDAPWRAVGFYMALTWFWDGMAPSLIQIGITRPTETYRRIFGMIAVQAKNVL